MLAGGSGQKRGDGLDEMPSHRLPPQQEALMRRSTPLPRTPLAAALVLALVLALVFALAGCGGVVVGSGDLVDRAYDFEGFTRVDVSQQFEVEVVRGDASAVNVTVDDNLVDRLEVSLEGDTLRIALEGGTVYQGTTQRATVTLPELFGMSLSGASQGSVAGFDSGDPLELELSGASTLELVDVSAGDGSFGVSGASHLEGEVALAAVAMELSGASRATLVGLGEAADLRASGASKLELGGFTLENAQVELSGASSATVDVSGTLDVEASGASNLRYEGDPSLGRVETSGASSIQPAGD
jgi:hypothetical protein